LLAPAATAAGALAFPHRPRPTTLSRCTRFPFPAGRAGGATVHHGAMNNILPVRRAYADDLPVILEMINDAATWLRTKNTDQWAQPWPSEEARDARVRRPLLSGDTWIVEEDGSPVATVTCRQHGNKTLWTRDERSKPAVYVSRLVVIRSVAGRGIGAALIDWAGQRGVRAWSAQWIRIDVWTTNVALHSYYEKRGFRHVRTEPFDKETYPSAALFQKPTSMADHTAEARFTEAPRRSPDSMRTPPGPPELVAATAPNLAACV
jgi:GNAT superfamily N-acetyltransferase